jgi:hypothetical protein
MHTLSFYDNNTLYFFSFEEVIEMEQLIRNGNVIFLTNYDIVDYVYYDRIANFLAVNMNIEPDNSKVYFDILPTESFDLFIRTFFADNHLTYPMGHRSIIKFIDAVYSIVVIDKFHYELVKFYENDKELNSKMSNLNIF